MVMYVDLHNNHVAQVRSGTDPHKAQWRAWLGQVRCGN
jgi:hypothetical protein